MNEMHEANRRKWEASAPRWKARRDEDPIWRRCHLEPGLGFEGKSLELFQKHIDVAGKRACVLGSGDNHAPFALAGMGATVTSVDISFNQLEIAKERARELNLEIEFVQADITNVDMLPDNHFDFACSEGGVTVWITDLLKHYAEASRILKPGGIFLSDELHPFRNIFAEDGSTLDRHYFETGPKQYLYDPKTGKSTLEASDAAVHKREQAPSSFQCHWTVSDRINAMTRAGFELLEFHEGPDEDCVKWNEKIVNGLPWDLILVVRKR